MNSPENFNARDFLAEERMGRLEEVRMDIATRLQQVCSDLSAEELESLVEKMARTQVRDEGLPAFRCVEY